MIPLGEISENMPEMIFSFSLDKRFPLQTQDREREPLDLCHRRVNLSEEPDAGNLQVRFCEGPGPTDIGLK